MIDQCGLRNEDWTFKRLSNLHFAIRNFGPFVDTD